ncbi:MAG: GNAT family N-acetyltransferase [Proteobacteria bacterium]|nr:GNAT family N-acetyltransferase [Pseudomonadota bacterium]
MSAPLTTDFRIEPADYRTDFQDLRHIRETVFVGEQKVPLELEWDALDPLCQHVIARDGENRAIGTGRLSPQHAIGRLAVLPEWRGRGVGAALLAALIDAARMQHWDEVELHAQVDAIAFYRKYGFEAFGEQYDEAGIRHQSMRLALTPFEERSPAPPRPPLAAVDTFEQALAATVATISLSRRDLCVFSRDLDPALLGQPAVIDALRRYATSGVDPRVRVLLLDPQSLAQTSHPWLDLAQRLPSVFEFRACEEEPDRQYPSAFLVGDRGALYFRPLAVRLDGESSDSAPARARQLTEPFERMWQRGRPCTEFRALGI